MGFLLVYSSYSASPDKPILCQSLIKACSDLKLGEHALPSSQSASLSLEFSQIIIPSWWGHNLLDLLECSIIEGQNGAVEKQ